MYKMWRAVPVEAIVGNLSCVHPSLSVFTKRDLPLRHHYTNNIRIGDVLMKPLETWSVYG